MKKSSFMLIIAAGAVMFLLTYLQSYTLLDEILYHFIWRRAGDDVLVKISSLGDIVQSQAIHYTELTGRVVVQFISQAILGLLNKTIYNVANAIVFALTVWAAARYTSKGAIKPLTVILILFTMVVLIPGFVDDYLWIEGSMNYLWVSLAVMAFIFIFEKKKDSLATTKDYLFSPLMLFIGWTHEGMVLPLAISLAGHFWLRRKTMRHNAALPYVAWFTAGALACSLAPSTVLRAIGGDGHVAASPLVKIALGLYTCTEMRTVWMLAILMAYSYKKHRRLLMLHLHRYGYLYFSVVLSICIIFASGVTQPRVCYFAEFLSMLLAVNLLLRLGAERHSTKLRAALSALIVAVLIPGIYYSYQGHKNYKYIMSQIKEGKTSLIRVRQVAGCDYFIRKFTLQQVSFGPNTYYFAPDPTDENVRCAAALLGKDSLQFLPDDMVERIMADPNSYTKYGEDATGMMMAMQIPEGTRVNGITFILGEDTPPIYKRPFMYKGYRYEAQRWQVVEINGRDFVFFDKPIPKISRRIKEIKINEETNRHASRPDTRSI